MNTSMERSRVKDTVLLATLVHGGEKMGEQSAVRDRLFPRLSPRMRFYDKFPVSTHKTQPADDQFDIRRELTYVRRLQQSRDPSVQ